MTSGKDGLSSSRSLVAGSGLPRHEAWRLIAVARSERTGLFAGDVDLGAEEVARFLGLAERRRSGEPLQYLEGSMPFGPVELRVDPRVLIPRPETEFLFTEAAATEPPPAVIVDLCTGSGALALALKHRFPASRVIGTDVSQEALDVAAANCEVNGLEVEWRSGDLFAALPDAVRSTVDLLVSNPPYVAAGEWDTLPADVRREPYLALVAGPRGTEVVERILLEADEWLSPGGTAWIEVGDGQASDLARAFPVVARPDQYGRERYVVLRRPRR